MWNKRKEEEFAPKPAATPPPAPSTTKESYPAMTTAPVSSFHDRGGMAVIGKSVVVKGQILSREDLTVDGEVEGSIEAQDNRLTIGPHGQVKAGVKAREVVILGNVIGNVDTTDKLEIRKDARLIGDIRTARVVIEDGAYFKGSIDIIKPEAPKQAPAPKQQAQQPAPPPPAPATATPAQATVAESKR